MEKTDHQLACFFGAIRHHDFNIHFTEQGDDKFLSGLFREMNRILVQFEENQTRLEERRLYYESIIRVLAHEIRNSITPIASLSADLIQYIDEYGKEGVIDGLQTIHQQAKQLNVFLHAYDRLTHLPDPVKAPVHIPALFNKLDRLLSSEEGGKNIGYVSPENMEILLDRNLVTLALINLIRNALQATANHPESEIRVEAGRDRNSSFIQVTDNGPGIPQERLTDVFTPFYSTRKEGSGIGLPYAGALC
ncbi:MAG: HAMP domain-containing histidine kinase, partial [Tannerellaceae bacterium]|nr:HAMP domain-containing histidine kinase [Tannerellaceae bacterium]